jgi:hypothetical protein
MGVWVLTFHMRHFDGMVEGVFNNLALGKSQHPGRWIKESDILWTRDENGGADWYRLENFVVVIG